MNEFARAREALEEEKRSLDKQLAEHGVAPGGGGVAVTVDEGFADTAQATAGRSEVLALVEHLTSTRSEVVAALERIDEGTYGKCAGCGEAIAPERLEAVPWASLCVACKQRVA